MGTVGATGRRADVSPRLVARITGLFYLLTFLAGIFAQGFVSNRLLAGNASATAAGILAHRSLFQLGFTFYMVEMVCNIIMIVLFYYVLRPAGRILALVATALGLAGCVIKTFSRVFYIVPLFVLESGTHASVFSTAQLQTQASLLLRVNNQGAGMALLFAGLYAVLTGYLIIRSTFLPRIIGVLAVIGGAGWLTFFSPTLGFQLFYQIAALGFLGALVLILWLLIVGVNEERWKAQASAGAASIWK